MTREAKQVWDDVNMKSACEEALCDVATEFRAGRLQWTFRQVYELVCDYPQRGALDTLEELQDDEDPVDGVPWCEGDALEEDCDVGASDSDAAHEEGHAPAVAGDGEGLEDAAPAKAASPSGDAAVSTSAAAELPLEVADAAEDHHRRVAALLRLKALADQAQSPRVALTIVRALHMVSRRVQMLSQTDSAVALALVQRQEEDAAAARAEQAEWATYTRMVRTRAALNADVADACDQLKKVRQDFAACSP